MKKKVRIKDVAEKAGVSVGTVDRVLHDRGNVSEDVKKKILAVMDQLGYERNLMASTLALNKTFKFIALLPDPSSDPYWDFPFKGVVSAYNSLKHYGIEVQCVFFDLFSPKDMLQKGKKCLSSPIDGLLFPPIFEREGHKILDLCSEKGVSTVIFNTNLPHPNALSYIGQDSFQSGVLAAKIIDFVIKDNDTALVVNLEKSIANARHILEKENGFRFYFANHKGKNIKILKKDFTNFDSKGKLQAFVNFLFEAPAPPSGIFVTNSRAYHLASCLSEKQKKDVILVGYDLIDQNIKFLNTNSINFLLNQNSREQGYLGVVTLFKAVFMKQVQDKTQYLPLDIVVSENVKYYHERENAVVKVL